eukprot:jgi/Hompol1/1631/HPOL_003726-RA
MYWNITHIGTSSETLNVLIGLQGSATSAADAAAGNATGASLAYSWLALGFGESMLDAQFIVCHLGEDYKYLRSMPGWIYIKIITVLVAIFVIFIMLLIILNNVLYLDRPHAILGLTITALILVQLIIGIISLSALTRESLTQHRPVIRIVHRCVGSSVCILAIAQMALGIETLYPWVEPRGKEVWIVYIVFVCFWGLAFAEMEIHWRAYFGFEKPWRVGRDREYVRAPIATTGVDTVAGGGIRDSVATQVERSSTTVGRRKLVKSVSGSPFDITVVRPLAEQFTWESLDEAVAAGRMLVVGNGRYVYDISRWVYSHPGGQIILHAVNGTDISNDYFHEAGFDAEEFTPKIEAPQQREGRNQFTLPRGQRHDVEPADSIRSWIVSTVDDGTHALAMLSELTDDDWSCVVKARRTHVHTRLAIQRLSQLLVGELQSSAEAVERYHSSQTLYQDPSATAGRPPASRIFDRSEYRRYAMSSKQLITTQLTSTPIYRLRFCLLYPYDHRDAAPRKFVPGECIEIQARVHGQIVSRYYSPLANGSLTAFDIFVKCVPAGIMSTFLINQNCGDRQFKVRGPFGSPLVSIERPLKLGSSQWLPDQLVFVAGGTGVTPFLQLLSYVFLPTLEKIRVAADYAPRFDDELELKLGDSVIVKHHYYDGWCFGLNLRTLIEGIFPLSCTTPRCGPRPHITLINCIHTTDDLIGKEILNAALLSYPTQLDIHHFIADREGHRGLSPQEAEIAPPVTIGDVPGFVHDGRINESKFQRLLKPIWSLQDRDPTKQRLIVCGPNGFAPFIVDSLTEFGAHGDDIVILPNEQWV